MPSPFPGMDPYLEHPEFFPGLHERLISYLSESLQTRLPDSYYADIGARVWIEASQRLVEPDVSILESQGPRETASPVAAIAASQPVVVHVPHDEVHESFLEIHSLRGGRRLVTAIEVLSRGNKTPGEHGRELYLRKQREILRGQVHLVEIDLLRGGTHTTAVPHARAVAAAGTFDYHVSVHRFDDLEKFLVYSIRLEQQLPQVRVPLLPGDPDVLVDLQAVFDRAYDTGPYARLVPYREIAPLPPLRPEQAKWASRILREKGFEPSF